MQVVYRAIDNSIHDTAKDCEAHETSIRQHDFLYQAISLYLDNADISATAVQIEAVTKFILNSYTLTAKYPALQLPS